MSAPTPATGDGSPTPGYYPDPSIPGYVRYWNGAAWVPGTSRPAPKADEEMPAAPYPAASSGSAAASAQAPSATPAAVEETGPVFLDEEPADEPARPEPATAWQADTSRQSGFGGERDHRVSWGGGGGSGQDDPSAGTGAPVDPRRPAAPTPHADPTGGALPGVRTPAPAGAADSAAAPESETRRPQAQPQPQPQPPAEGTVTIRALRPRSGGSAPAGQPEGTMTIRSLGPGGPSAPTAPAQRRPQTQQPHQPQAPVQPQQSQPHVPAQSAPPVTNGPGGGAASWPQQVHRLAQTPQPDTTGPDQPVVPWKPPVNDPFLQAAQAQAAARPASLGKRLAARLIDTVLLGVLVGAVAVPVGSQARAHIDEKIEAAKQSGETVTVWLVDGTTVGHLGIILGALLVLGVLYEALPTAKWGRTLGKKLCGLTVWGIESHEPPSFGAALRRWLVYGVLGLLAVGVLNVLWCLFDRPWRQCWHDKAARTFVTG